MANASITFESGTVGNDVASLFDASFVQAPSTFQVSSTNPHLGTKCGSIVYSGNNYAEAVSLFGSSIVSNNVSYYVKIRSSGNTRTSHDILGLFTTNASAKRGFVGVDFSNSQKLTIGADSSTAISSTSSVPLPSDEWIRIDHTRDGTTLTVRAYKGPTLESPSTSHAFITLTASSSVSGTDRYYFGSEFTGSGNATIDYDSISWDTASMPAPRGPYTRFGVVGVDLYVNETQTWIMPNNAFYIEVICIGGGGGGGSGGRWSNPTPSLEFINGGGGGGGGGYSRRGFLTSTITGPVTVIAGAGGAGGAVFSPVGSGATAGNPGSSGTQSSFGNYLKANGGGGGGFGGVSTSDPNATAGAGGPACAYGSDGGSCSQADPTVVLGFPRAQGGAGGGSAGGGCQNQSSVQVLFGGRQGRNSWATVNTGGNGGTTGVAGSDGGTSGIRVAMPGAGGGGAGCSSGTGVAGGAGGLYGGGGGGGGATVSNTSNVGAGGAGADGAVMIISYGY